MRNKEDEQLAKMIEEALTEDFVAEREQERIAAREAINKIQEKNRKAFKKQFLPNGRLGEA